MQIIVGNFQNNQADHLAILSLQTNKYAYVLEATVLINTFFVKIRGWGGLRQDT